MENIIERRKELNKKILRLTHKNKQRVVKRATSPNSYGIRMSTRVQ